MRKPCINCGLPGPNTRCDRCANQYLIDHPPRPKRNTTERGYGSQWQAIRRTVLERDQWTCYICEKHLVGSDATVDHVVAISKDRSLALAPANLRACCRSCNSRKQNR